MAVLTLNFDRDLSQVNSVELSDFEPNYMTIDLWPQISKCKVPNHQTYILTHYLLVKCRGDDKHALLQLKTQRYINNVYNGSWA